MPNLFAPLGRSNTLEGLAISWHKGREAVADQHYDVNQILVDGERAAVELDWQGTPAKPLGELPAGTHLKAHVTMLIEFRAGKITRQRDYVCYYPLSKAASA